MQEEVGQKVYLVYNITWLISLLVTLNNMQWNLTLPVGADTEAHACMLHAVHGCSNSPPLSRAHAIEPSSLKSPQVSLPSHTEPLGTQKPLLHRNASGPQAAGEMLYQWGQQIKMGSTCKLYIASKPNCQNNHHVSSVLQIYVLKPEGVYSKEFMYYVDIHR